MNLIFFSQIVCYKAVCLHEEKQLKLVITTGMGNLNMNINYREGFSTDYDNICWIAVSCIFLSLFVFHLMVMEIVIFITLFCSLEIVLAAITIALYYFSHTFRSMRCLVSLSCAILKVKNFSSRFAETLKLLKTWHRTSLKSNDKSVSQFLWISHSEEEREKNKIQL